MRLKLYLKEKRKAWSDEKETKLKSEIESDINATIIRAEKLPPPPIDTMFDDVYAKLPWNLFESKNELLYREGDDERQEKEGKNRSIQNP